ncbi:MAG: branched-chain-amino-acid transaminase [Spirochaetales bacterium]|nr:branched-chain-amino-acid transaminase [Spirochaetales bacterium]
MGKSKAIINVDGLWCDREEAKVSVYDHGLLYGDGLFEGIRIYGGKIFKLEEHLDRLFEGARAIMLTLPLSKEELAALLVEGVRRYGETEGYIRLVVTRGAGSLGISPDSCERATVIMIVDGIQLYPKERYEEGIAVVTAASRRLTGDIFDPRIKSLNYLNNVLAKMEAKQAGCLEAVMLNKEGYVCECTGDNIFVVKKGVLLTPPSYLGMLEGITRNTMIELAREGGIPFEERVMTRFDLYTADECFLTGSGAEVIPVVTVDGRSVGSGRPGEISRKMTELFKKRVLS